MLLPRGRCLWPRWICWLRMRWRRWERSIATEQAPAAAIQPSRSTLVRRCHGCWQGRSPCSEHVASGDGRGAGAGTNPRPPCAWDWHRARRWLLMCSAPWCSATACSQPERRPRHASRQCSISTSGLGAVSVLISDARPARHSRPRGRWHECAWQSHCVGWLDCRFWSHRPGGHDKHPGRSSGSRR